MRSDATTSVGVLISSPAGILVFERATAPVGIAPVAGHVDQHGSPEQSARAEATEEVGLAVTDLRLKLARWRPSRCHRPALDEVGHQWWIFQARVAGQLNPSVREVRAPRWAHLNQLQQYAQRTAAYAAGRISEAEFTVRPMLEPVWARFLHDLRLVLLTGDALAQIDRVIWLCSSIVRTQHALIGSSAASQRTYA